MPVRTAKITRKGQVTIPVDFREKYNLHVGDTVLFEDRDERLTLQHPNESEDWTAGSLAAHIQDRRYYSPAELRQLAEISIAEQVMDGIDE